jgi:hypothetical protein
MILSLAFFLGSSLVPGAARREALRCRTGTQGSLVTVQMGPGSAAQHEDTLHRVRDMRLIYSSFPIATAVSPMRLEKPHSLSYQAITRTSVPFCTLVWSMWNVAEWGSWLKSIETFGAVV